MSNNNKQNQWDNLAVVLVSLFIVYCFAWFSVVAIQESILGERNMTRNPIEIWIGIFALSIVMYIVADTFLYPVIVSVRWRG